MATNPVPKKIGRPRNRYCTCGCGEKLTGRKSTKYANPTHRQRVYRAAMPKAPPDHPIRKRDRIIEQLVEALRTIGTPEALEAIEKAEEELR